MKALRIFSSLLAAVAVGFWYAAIWVADAATADRLFFTGFITLMLACGTVAATID